MRYQNASSEPLEIIRINECDGRPGLTAARFQALWNEIERLNKANLQLSTQVKELSSIVAGEEDGREYRNETTPPR